MLIAVGNRIDTTVVVPLQRIEYASKPSKASIVAEHGPEALFDPTIMQAVGLAPASSSNRLTKVTTSSAQADQKGRERKRQREEARQRGETVDSSGGEEEEDEEEEDEGPETKIRKVESASEEPIAHSEATSKPVAADEVKEQVQEEEGEEEDEEGGEFHLSVGYCETRLTFGPLRHLFLALQELWIWKTQTTTIDLDPRCHDSRGVGIVTRCICIYTLSMSATP